MNPKTASEWVKIGRDVLITGLAGFMLVYETVVVTNPNALIVGAGLTLLGLPVAFRLDQFFRPDDPYSGPGGYYRE